MNNSVRFSIIMPTCNRRDCICTAVDSVLSQSGYDFELIIVDDCSCDNTENIIRTRYSHELKSGRLRYIRLDIHSGVCVARNIGLRNAKNDWIAYCDTDNKWFDGYLSAFADAIHSNPEKLCFYAKMMRKSNGCVFGVDNFSWASLARGNYIDLGAFVHNISLYKRYGGFDEKLYRLVDWDIILLYTKKSTPHFVNSCVLLYDDTNTRTRISNSVELGAAKRYIERKHKIKHTRISTGDRKMFWLKFARFCHVIHGDKYNRLKMRANIKSSGLFDVKWYLTTYPDVAAAGADAISHYLEFGWREGRNPSSGFDNNAYLADNPDVAAAGVCPLVHYIMNGRDEGRHIRAIGGNVTIPSDAKPSFGQRIMHALRYPIRVRDEYEQLRRELRPTENRGSGNEKK